MSEAPKHEHFNRQRRNLIAISMFIILYRALGLKVTEISFFGNSASVGAVSLFPAVIFLVILYFSWRYTHYLNDEKGLELSLTQYRNIFIKNLKKEAMYLLPKHGNQINRTITDIQRFEEYRSFKHHFVSKELLVTYGYNDTNDSIGKYAREDIKFPIKSFFKSHICAVIEFIFFGSHFSEYLFPYLFAFLAIIELFHFSLVLPVADLIVPGYQRPLR